MTCDRVSVCVFSVCFFFGGGKNDKRIRTVGSGLD